jgi:hypothetical protein
VAGVGDEAPHPLLRGAGDVLRPACRCLRGGTGTEGRLDLGEHAVERAPEPADLGAGVAVWHAPGQVAGGDRRGGLFDLDQRAEARAHHRHPHGGEHQQDGGAHRHVHAAQAADGAVDLVHAGRGDHEAVGSVLAGRHHHPPPPLAGGCRDRERIVAVRRQPGGVAREPGRRPALLDRFVELPHHLSGRVPPLHQERARCADPDSALARSDHRRCAQQPFDGEPARHGHQLLVETADQITAEHGDARHADQGQRDRHQHQHGDDQLHAERRPGEQPRGRRPRPPRPPGHRSSPRIAHVTSGGAAARSRRS